MFSKWWSEEENTFVNGVFGNRMIMQAADFVW